MINDETNAAGHDLSKGAMKLAIDSYCYHRHFGEWYPNIQSDSGRRMTVWDFLRRARDYRVAGVSLEACFLSLPDDELIAGLRTTLDDYGLEAVWAWGHPNGLGSGKIPEAQKDLIRHFGFAQRIGAKVIRICAGSRHTKPSSWAEHKRDLIPMLRDLAGAAEEQGVVMAIENHLDLLADEMIELVTCIDSPWLGVCLDTGNNLRMLEDPLLVVEKLAPFARATHIKDIAAYRGNPREFSFWPSVPLGTGLVNIAEVIQILHRTGYRGLLAIEIDYLHPMYEEEEAAIAQSVKYLRTLLTPEST